MENKMEFQCTYSYDQNCNCKLNCNGSIHVNADVKSAVITEPRQAIGAFTKINPACTNTSAEVKTLLFTDSTSLHYLPVFRDLVTNHFPNLEELKVSNCELRNISKRDLEGLQNLKSLELENCGLISLPDDLFTNMPNLQSVSFANNQIWSASSRLLEPFDERENFKVDLRGNANIDTSTHVSLEELKIEIDQKCSRPDQPPVAN